MSISAKTVLIRLFGLMRNRSSTGIKYWERRARTFGKRSVLNIGHSEGDFERVTKWQKEILYPLLRLQLNGSEHLVLDFGCGPGRFTADLAQIVSGNAIGVDPVRHLLELAPFDERTEYSLLDGGNIPCPDASIDLVWSCLVLGGLTEPGSLGHAVNEIERILKPAGLVFLVENTSSKPNGATWHFRSPEEYVKQIPFAELKVLSRYEDLGETITVMAGRKKALNTFTP